jgi:hypothetical protein
LHCPKKGAAVEVALRRGETSVAAGVKFIRNLNPRKWRKAMKGSLGLMSFSKLCTAAEIGIQTGSITQLIKAYLEWSEGFAAYWIQMKNGALLLQMVPENPESGAIYLLDLDSRTFYLVSFEGPDDTLTRRQFEQIVEEYELLRYASNPRLIHAPVQKAGIA